MKNKYKQRHKPTHAQKLVCQNALSHKFRAAMGVSDIPRYLIDPPEAVTFPAIRGNHLRMRKPPHKQLPRNIIQP